MLELTGLHLIRSLILFILKQIKLPYTDPGSSSYYVLLDTNQLVTQTELKRKNEEEIATGQSQKNMKISNVSIEPTRILAQEKIATGTQTEGMSVKIGKNETLIVFDRIGENSSTPVESSSVGDSKFLHDWRKSEEQ